VVTLPSVEPVVQPRRLRIGRGPAVIVVDAGDVILVAAADAAQEVKAAAEWWAAWVDDRPLGPASAVRPA
jgi:hypothetical protein